MIIGCWCYTFKLMKEQDDYWNGVYCLKKCLHGLCFGTLGLQCFVVKLDNPQQIYWDDKDPFSRVDDCHLGASSYP